MRKLYRASSIRGRGFTNYRRERSKKSWFEPKDIVSLLLSAAAFLISAGTFYINVWRQKDNVSLVGANVPGPVYLDGKLFLSKSAKGSFTIINSGTRVAVIESADLVVVQRKPKDNDTPSCTDENKKFFPLEFEPFILKPGDAANRSFKLLRETFDIEITEDVIGGELVYHLPLAKDYVASNGSPAAFVDVDLCLRASVTTPSEATRSGNLPMGRWRLRGEDGESIFLFSDDRSYGLAAKSLLD